MKILTKEEEAEHYNATLKGGCLGGVAGLAVGGLGVYAAAVRYPAFRQLTVPLRAFLITSSGTFSAIISADRASRGFEASRHPEDGYKDKTARLRREADAKKATSERVTTWFRENRYFIVGGSWVASMAIALGIVGRSPYLSTQQKLVQARVYAQGLTVAVLIATAAFEISDQKKGEGKYETIQIVDPNDPEHKHLIDKKIHKEEYVGEDQWKDMIEIEERKEKELEQHAHEQAMKDKKAKNQGKSKSAPKTHEEEDKKQNDQKEESDKGKSARG